MEGVDEHTWKQLRPQLVAAGLIQVEVITGHPTPYLKFHPTLARVLGMELGQTEREALQQRHQQRYYALAGYLYHGDSRNPVSIGSIAKRELPNLLAAVGRALDQGHEDAVDFVDSVNRFLKYFGMSQDLDRLTDRKSVV